MALIAYLRSAKNDEGRQCNAQRDAIATTLGPIDQRCRRKRQYNQRWPGWRY